jgi:hypothetical protein
VPRWSAERWAASSGILFAILLVVSNFLAGTPPHYNASSDKIGAFLTDHHRVLMVQAVLGGVMIVLFLWFVASYAGMFRDAGQGRLATIVYGSGVVIVGIFAAASAIMVALVQLRGTLDSGVIAALYGVSVFFYFKMFWAMAALAFASYLAIHRSHVLPEWYGMLSLAGGLVFVIGGLSVRMHGFFSPAGAMGWIAFFVFAAWVFVGSWLCMQKHPAHSPAMSPAHSH